MFPREARLPCATRNKASQRGTLRVQAHLGSQAYSRHTPEGVLSGNPPCSTVPLFPQRPKFQQALLHDGLADFILCLEVVVDVADRDLGRLSDIGEARLPEPMSVRQLHSRANQPRSFVRL